MIHLSDLQASSPQLEVRGASEGEWWPRFCFDSRLIEPGDLFVAVRTARGDGHDHVAQAFAAGARAALVSVPHSVPSDRCALVVEDTVAAMERYGAWVVRAWGPRVVAVTGTVGKTGTKELIADVLATRFTVFRTPGNYSGRFGLAVALGGLRPEHQIAVVEMATGHFGEIAAMCDLAPPEVGVVTAIDAAHLVALGDVEGVAREKGVLVERLPENGLAVLAADDPRVADLAERTAAQVVTVGAGPEQEVTVHAVEVTPSGTTLEISAGTWHDRIHTPLLGAQVATSVMAALAVGRRFGVEPETAATALASSRPVAGRLHPLAGLDGSLLLDDSYNAAPRSVLAGLEVLAAIGGTPAIVVLGEMAELGGDRERWHRVIGQRAGEVADVLITQGRAAAWIAEAAMAAGLAPERVSITFTPEDAADAARAHLGPGATALIKGSASSRMERVVALLLDPSVDPAEVLVRQDRAWQSIGVVSTERPTWLEIDLGAVAHNVRHLTTRALGADVMVVLKADAYGHGAVQVAHTALRHGATWLGVACVPEARVLRDAGIRAPILVLGHTPAWQAREALSLDLTLAVFDRETARAYGSAAQALDRTAQLHVKVDTGMHRLGVPAEDAAGFLREVANIDGVAVSGLFTHFACADDPSAQGVAATDAQLSAFRAVVADLESTGDRPRTVHAANSAGLLMRSDATFDLVRPGIAVYGLAPGPDVPADNLLPALSWRSQVAQVHDLGPGEGVGYGHMWRTARPSRVATVPVGYADGLRRAPATWHHVLVRGQRAPLAGRVSMDQISIDVTDIPGVRRGDEVVLIGSQGDEAVPADVVASWLGTSAYEVVSEILSRVPRVS